MPDIVYPVRFNLVESSVPIEGVFVSIWDEDLNNLVVPNATTDEDGWVTIGLPNGIYNAVFFCPGFTFQTLFFGVVNNPITFTVTGDISIVSPIVRGYCLVYGFVKDVANKPIVDTIVRIRINPNPQYKETTVVSKQDYVIYTDESGYFEQSLLGGLKVTATIPEANYQVAAVLPLSGKIDITSLERQFTVK